ncbi:MAG: PilZ domain-containing protein [Thermoanaerobaculales bacterium]|nr:PilZ domain-containing protein [Thermoanaerobaculales bacterium]
MRSYQRHVLMVGADEDALERIAPMLRRAEFDVHTAAPSPVVFDLVLGTSFELVLVRYPLKELALDDLLDALRRDGSWCKSAAVVLLADPNNLDDALAQVDLGVNRAIGIDWPEGRLHRAIADLLEVAPRISLRVLVHMKVEVENQNRRSLYQTVNISRTGMLLRGDDNIDPGTRFSFFFGIPDGRRLVEGTAEVVRRTNPMREGTSGLGVRFLRIAGEGEEQLESFVTRYAN